ncbi:M16 family metallopeptidase [Kaarinaea lacus]
MRTKLVSLCLLLFSPTLFASISIQHWTTDNGARVYYAEAPELPMVDIQLTFDAGSARDNGKDGVALLTNGLLSEGAGGLNAQQIAEQFEGLGAQFGNDSQRDMATLKLRSLSEQAVLNSALDTLALVLTKPTFPVDAFERERKRLLVGIEQRKQSPGELADVAFYKNLFNSHPYASQPSGEESTVKSLVVADLKSFYQQYYVASNLVIAIVGNVDRSQAEQIANNLVKDLPKGKAAEPIPEVSTLDKSETIKIDHPSTQTHVLMGQPGVKRGDPDYYALYVGNHILGGNGLVSRLSDEIREKRGLAYSSYSFFLPMREFGPFQIGLQTRNDQTEEALKVVDALLKDFVEKGPTEAELTASKKNITGGFPLRISSNSKILGYIAMIGFYGLPLDYLDTFNARVEALTVADIQDAFKRRVDPGKMVTVLVGKQ